MKTMKMSLKRVVIEKTIKIIDDQMKKSITRDCWLFLLDEPKMPRELIEEQLKESN